MKKKFFLLISIMMLLVCFTLSVSAENDAVCEQHTYSSDCDADCNVCGAIRATDATHNYNREIIDTPYLKSKASCLSPAGYYKSCVCGAFDSENSEVFYYGKYGEHSGGKATCTVKAVCDTCSKYYGNYANHICVLEIAEEQYLKAPATCASLAVYYKSCECGAASHTATFYHGDFKPHEYGQEVATPKFLYSTATCEKFAVYYESCICGLRHPTNTFEDSASGYAPHIGGVADCEHEAICEVCNVAYGGEGHDFTACVVAEQYKADDATCTSKAYYYISCSICSATSQATNKEAKFEDKNSNRIAHKYEEQVAEDRYIKTPATCTKKAEYYYSCVCGACDMKVAKTFNAGETKKHSFTEQIADEKFLALDATCTSEAYYYYSCECGATSTRTFTAGGYAAHTWDEGTVVKEETLFKNGETKRKCTKCNREQTFDDIPAVLEPLNGIDFKILIGIGVFVFVFVLIILITIISFIAKGARKRKYKRALKRAKNFLK